MNRQIAEELHPVLARSVDALDIPPPVAAEQGAQQRLLGRLRSATSTAPPRMGGWWAAAAASVLAMVLVAVPLLSERGHAFASVQAHFRDFETLSMQVEQRFDGRVIQASRMVVDQQGTLRTDVGELLSIVVDPARGRVLMLQHGPRAAITFPIQPGDEAVDEDIDWLAEVRDFKGKAVRLDTPRIVDGREARGWALEIDGMSLVLWVDGQGVPLAMDAGGEGGLSVHYRFAFDVEVPAGFLSSEIPEGYTRVERDAP